MRVSPRTQISETARTHKFAALRHIAHRHIVVDHKITIIRQTINFSGTKTASILGEDPFFFFFLVFASFRTQKPLQFWTNSRKKCVHAKLSAHRDHKKLKGTLEAAITNSTNQSSRSRRALSCTITERLESTERILPRHFSSMPETQLWLSAWKEGTGIFLPKPGQKSYFEAKSFRMITLLLSN